ncbi:MAG: hypothetical protein JSW00_03415 [Thermoplasmata archaeon]|nr:MAG: hypothetical protein JSW00_03415 [Thermoplasmata archaeon]
MKRYYIVGFILLLAFLVFVFAGTAGSDSEVVVGTVGFFGIVAMLPLFLYLLFIDTRLHPEEIQEQAPDIEGEKQFIEGAGATVPQHARADKPEDSHDLGREPIPTTVKGVDRDFIESIRAKQKDTPEEIHEKTEPEPAKEIQEHPKEIMKTGLIDLPHSVQKETEPESEPEKGIDQQLDLGKRVGQVDIHQQAGMEPVTKKEMDEQLIEKIRGEQTRTKEDVAKESDKEDAVKDSDKKEKLEDSPHEEDTEKIHSEEEGSG